MPKIHTHTVYIWNECVYFNIKYSVLMYSTHIQYVRHGNVNDMRYLTYRIQVKKSRAKCLFACLCDCVCLYVYETMIKTKRVSVAV